MNDGSNDIDWPNHKSKNDLSYAYIQIGSNDIVWANVMILFKSNLTFQY